MSPVLIQPDLSKVSLLAASLLLTILMTKTTITIETCIQAYILPHAEQSPRVLQHPVSGDLRTSNVWSSGWSRIIMALAMFPIIMVKTILRVTVEEKPRRCWYPGSESCNWIHCQQKSLFKMGRGGWGGVGANGFKTIITIFVNVIRVNSIKIISKWYHNAWSWVKAGWPILSWFRHKLGWYRNNHLGKLNRKSQAGEQIP